MNSESLTILFGGEGGEGVISVGEALSRAASRSGRFVYGTLTYPAEIKGGLAVFQLRIGANPIPAVGSWNDVAVCLNREAYEGAIDTIAPDGVLVLDPLEVKMSDDEKAELQERHISLIEIPFTQLAKEAGARQVKSGVVAGLCGRWLQLPAELVEKTFLTKLSSKRNAEEIIEKNRRALSIGAKTADEITLPFHLNPVTTEQHNLTLTGNQATALGALAAGCRYVAGYPITPATPILEFLARELPKLDGSFVQTEDEISALASCIGASYAGKRAMTATSGPGFALMSELVNLAVMSEVPVVIVDVQRAGPSTGMPTKTEQSDLLYALYGSPGDSPRIVIAPATVGETYRMMSTAFTAAEATQSPCIVLTDQSLGYRLVSVPREELTVQTYRIEKSYEPVIEPFLRYRDTESGVSPVHAPGTNRPVFIAGGLEHDEAGQPDYSDENHIRMADKRERKLKLIERFPEWQLGVEREGTEGGIGIISWGSTLGAISETLNEWQIQDGIVAGHFHPRFLSPFPVNALEAWMKRLDRIIVIEENNSGQLAHLIQSFGNHPVERIHRGAGVPFSAHELLEALRKTVGTSRRGHVEHRTVAL